MKRIALLLLFVLVLTAPAFAQTSSAPCNGTYSGTFGGATWTVNLHMATSTAAEFSTPTLLLGELSSGNIILPLLGFVDSNGACFVSAWLNGHPAFGSAIYMGKLTETTGNGSTAGTFTFGGGHSTNGLVGPVSLTLTKAPFAVMPSLPAFPTASLATASYAGVYTATLGSTPVTLSLAQGNSTQASKIFTQATMLYGKLNVANSVTLNVQGFVDANNDAYLLVWYGPATLVGKLKFKSGSTTLAALDFSNGYTSTGTIGEMLFDNVSVANAANAATANFAGTYSGYYSGSCAGSTCSGQTISPITLTQSGTTLTGSGSHYAYDTGYVFTDTITGTVSGNVATVTWTTTDACAVTQGTLTLNGTTIVIDTELTSRFSCPNYNGQNNPGLLDSIKGQITK